MGQRMREGMHIVTTAKAESVGEIELGVDEHENGCRLNVQIKRAWDVVCPDVKLYDETIIGSSDHLRHRWIGVCRRAIAR